LKLLRFGKGRFQLTPIRAGAESIRAVKLKLSAEISESAAKRSDGKNEQRLKLPFNASEKISQVRCRAASAALCELFVR